ncbi:MAG: pantoate--beta-alanine ligase [Betaproteobacteria bacterium]|nr:MAG: pantoate--beta-alanine ligase [Betaproteobacteria bacterium]
MHTLHTVAELRAAVQRLGAVAFVPTMGNLHAGHIALVHAARHRGLPIVASVFVNPLQFGPSEDLAAYPRSLDADTEQLLAAGCDLLFAPSVAEMYPEAQTFSIIPPLADTLCGASRPGHFAGVATVVLKLFNMVQPRLALFGKKDYQQLFILRGLVRQFNLPIEVIGIDTVRAEDGLALSSRNGYLSAPERAKAARLYQTLNTVAAAIVAGARDHARLEREAETRLSEHGWQVDYIRICALATLTAAAPTDTALVVLGAARLGNTRLIDNLEVTSPPHAL